MRVTKGLKQAYDTQDFAFEALMALRGGMTDGEGKLCVDKDGANAVATLVRAWQSAQEQIRLHRNKPLPGSLRPTRKSDKDATAGGLVS